MIFTLQTPSLIELPHRPTNEFHFFLQAVLNRYTVGSLRYGTPERRQRYMTRLSIELRKYKTGGNFEHLLNTAVYAFLESFAPENRRLHFDPTAASATRELLG